MFQQLKGVVPSLLALGAVGATVGGLDISESALTDLFAGSRGLLWLVGLLPAIVMIGKKLYERFANSSENDESSNGLVRTGARSQHGPHPDSDPTPLPKSEIEKLRNEVAQMKQEFSHVYDERSQIAFDEEREQYRREIAVLQSTIIELRRQLRSTGVAFEMESEDEDLVPLFDERTDEDLSRRY